MKGVYVLAAAACLFAGAEILHAAPGSAQTAGESNSINAKSLCGTWENVPGSGGFQMFSSNNGITKGSGKDRGEHSSIKYTITDTTSRTAIAIQNINMKQGQSFKIGDEFKSTATRNLIGVTRKNVILFGVQGEANAEIWTLLKPGIYDVAGVEHGPNAMSYYYTIKQTLKSPCKGD